MNALDYLNAYLKELERRLQVSTVARGLALLGVVALAATIVLVLITNAFAFSGASLTGARVVLFVALALAIGLGLALPLTRVNRRRAARQAEKEYPEFEERLLTFAEARKSGAPDAFLELLADDALTVSRTADPARIVTPGRLVALFSAAAISVGVLLWIMAAPGFLGYGSSLLWAGTPRGGDAPFYDIELMPGNKTVRRGGDQLVTARLLGFQTSDVALYARFESASKWEEVPMQPQPGGAGFEFLFAGLPEAVDYYVKAGAVKTPEFRLGVVDLPKVKNIQVTYHYPSWMRRNDEVEDDGGDLRAVEGTEAELLIETDKPLTDGRILLDDGSEVALSNERDNFARGTVTISRDGLYYLAAVSQEESVRITEDYFIEALQESAPTLRVRRPGRDYRASPIEEVTVGVEAQDDYGLQELSLRYSVNGGPEQAVQMLGQRGATDSTGSTTLFLENHDLSPGDLVSFYAVARDARASSRTDMFFIEAQPFEREFSQSQQSGGQGGMGGQQDGGRISPRQKEIIAATWNILRDEKRDRQKAVEDGKFLSDVQSKLRDQAKSLAKRMAARQLASANEEFQAFTENMEAAAEQMEEAAARLGDRRWRDALQPEQKALQHLLRAEAVFRQIQVARGSQGGGGGGNMGRDLENLFDLELDTEKNQYETGQRASNSNQRSQEIDEALQKLAELARRQQELAEQQRRNEQTSQQRWQQEMLRREAEELRRQIEQLSRQSSQSQQGQMSRSQQGQSSQQGSSGQSGDPRLERALERLRQATEDMRQAASSSRRQQGQTGAESRRAAERLREATDLLGSLRRQEAAGQLADISERARQLSEQQREFADKLRELYRDHQAVSGQKNPVEGPPPADPQEVMKLAEEKRGMSEELDRLEDEMEDAVRDLAAGQKAASSKLREALGEMQQRELGLRMKYLSEWISRGLGAYAWLREAPVTEGLDRLAEQTKEAQQALGQEAPRDGNLETALSRVEQLRRELERLTRGAPREGEQAGGQQQAGNQQGQRGQEQAQGNQGGQGMRSGQQPGMRQSPQRAGGSGRTFSAMNLGDRTFDASGRPLTPQQLQAMERTYREGVRDLSRLRGEVRDNPELARELTTLMREMQSLDPSRFRGNPELVEQLRSEVLPGLEQIELRLRRELQGDEEGQVKAVLSRPVPPGYAEAVAEYYRKLSSGK